MAPIQSKPLASAQKKPMASIQRNPMASVQRNPMASVQRKPLASVQRTSIFSAQNNPMPAGQNISIASVQKNPLPAGQSSSNTFDQKDSLTSASITRNSMASVQKSPSASVSAAKTSLSSSHRKSKWIQDARLLGFVNQLDGKNSSSSARQSYASPYSSDPKSKLGSRKKTIPRVIFAADNVRTTLELSKGKILTLTLITGLIALMFIAAVLLFMVGYDSGLYYQQLYKDGCSECPDPTLITATIILLIMVCPTIVILLLTNTRFLPDVLQLDLGINGLIIIGPATACFGMPIAFINRIQASPGFCEIEGEDWPWRNHSRIRFVDCDQANIQMFQLPLMISAVALYTIGLLSAFINCCFYWNEEIDKKILQSRVAPTISNFALLNAAAMAPNTKKDIRRKIGFGGRILLVVLLIVAVVLYEIAYLDGEYIPKPDRSFWQNNITLIVAVLLPIQWIIAVLLVTSIYWPRKLQRWLPWWAQHLVLHTFTFANLLMLTIFTLDPEDFHGPTGLDLHIKMVETSLIIQGCWVFFYAFIYSNFKVDPTDPETEL